MKNRPMKSKKTEECGKQENLLGPLAQNKLMEMSGSSNEMLAVSTWMQAASHIPISLSKEEKLKALEISAQALMELKPRDYTEGTLCAQITALDGLGMEFIKRAANSCAPLPHIESTVSMATKLLRLKNETIETLIRYRRNGEQKVVVQHINLNDQSQAIIGDMRMGGGGC